MKTLTVFTDGGARGNPGPAAIGVVIKDERDEILKKLNRKIGIATNNVAEYEAIVSAFSHIVQNPDLFSRGEFSQIKFFLDSTLVVNQLNGKFRVKDATLREYLLKVRILESEVGIPAIYAYIPREKNQEADFLVNSAFDSPT